jgi:hypothetical protein
VQDAVSGGEVDLTQSNNLMSCNLVCPFNQEEGGVLSSQPCIYTVMVQEVFKGNYSVSRRGEGGRRWEGKEGGGKEEMLSKINQLCRRVM